MRRLVCLLLMGMLVAQDLPKGRNQQPKIKRPFSIDYYHLPIKDTTNIKGRVLVSFFVDEFGKVINPEIIDTFNTTLNHAIIDRVMAIKFEPAKQNGRPVAVRYQLPIVFK